MKVDTDFHSSTLADLSVLAYTALQLERYPMCVFSSDKDGNTLYHYAIKHENDRLLALLLDVGCTA